MPLDEQDLRCVRRWLVVAFVSLLLAGVLSLLVVVARVPPFDRLVGDPLFFKRCLVTHVDLALVVWFYAFLASLFFLVPGRRPSNTVSRESAYLAGAGVVLLLAGAAVPQARPLLANYVPLIDSPLFTTGLAAIGAALTFAFLDARLLPGNEGGAGLLGIPPAARVALRAAALAFLVAMLTLGAALGATPGGLLPETRAELVFWGPGHVLQLASVAGMLAAWTILLGGALGESPVSRRAATALFAVYTLPLLGAPLLAAHGTTTNVYRTGFTRLMELGIFPVVLVYLGLCLRALARAPRAARRDPRVLAFATSAALTLVGFVIGALIEGSNTVVPAHYHASIGAVTVAYMAVAYRILDAVRAPVRSARLRRLSAWQPALFGVGQTIFAIGFGLAGAHGMARKAFGAEQHVRTAGERIGLCIMGAGGLVAVTAGIFFLVIVGAALRGAWAQRERHTWQTASIRSRS
jgi:heme/copper-type cytochrome/quinol oxidase subunit 1